MGKSSQAKGRRGEIELVKVLQSYGIPAEPGTVLNYGHEPDIKGVAGIHVECKRRENVNLSAALAQAEADAQKFGDGLPAVFHRKNRERWRVTMPLESWIVLYGKTVCRCGGHCSADKNGQNGKGDTE